MIWSCSVAHKAEGSLAAQSRVGTKAGCGLIPQLPELHCHISAILGENCRGNKAVMNAKQSIYPPHVPHSGHVRLHHHSWVFTRFQVVSKRMFWSLSHSSWIKKHWNVWNCIHISSNKIWVRGAEKNGSLNVFDMFTAAHVLGVPSLYTRFSINKYINRLQIQLRELRDTLWNETSSCSIFIRLHAKILMDKQAWCVSGSDV